MKNSQKTSLIMIGVFIFLCLMLSQCTGSPVNKTKNEDRKDTIIEESLPAITVYSEPLPVSVFDEIWAYVVAGREAALTENLPLTDVCYFGAEINSYGSLIGVPRRQNISFPGRVHLVVVCNGQALTYFTLLPGSNERKTLIADLLSAARNFDGLQIDFENVPARSADAFLSFLRELRAGLPKEKMFTVALPARTRKLENDIYDYDKIKPIVDRILVMAYDEHWSGSRPGAVASMDWCRRVADYSLRAIGREKLIMGLPFYGRAWGDYTPSRALVFSTTDEIIKGNNSQIRYEDGIPTFDYDVNVSVKVYYDDEYSLSARMEMYRSMNVSSIGFWRLGQETPEVWKYIGLRE